MRGNVLIQSPKNPYDNVHTKYVQATRNVLRMSSGCPADDQRTLVPPGGVK